MSEERLPVIFFGHGSPMNAIEDNEFSRTWKGLASTLPKPRAILCVSAHWLTESTLVTAMLKPKTIHDFGGFPRELYEIQDSIRILFGEKLNKGIDATKEQKKSPYAARKQSAIIKLRNQTGFAAVKIKGDLHLPVSINTIHRFLAKKGLLNEYGNHRRPHYQKTTHMHLKNTFTVGKLQMDVKYITPELSGLPYTCFEYAVIDIYSRYKEAVILNHLDQDGSILALMTMLQRLPFQPDFIQTDNGLEFQGRFHQYCEQTGLTHHLIHKSTPNENAVIERTFRTDEEEFFFRMEQAPKDYDELRSMFADFLYWYNYKRIHLGIHLKTPFEVIRLSQMS